jgi:hypothetical protein
MIRVKKKKGDYIAVREQQDEQGERMQRRGRRSFKRYSFDEGDCFDASFAQIISPLPAIPQIVGPPPPSYPGNKPDSTADVEIIRKWTCEARYLLSFIATCSYLGIRN